MKKPKKHIRIRKRFHNPAYGNVAFVVDEQYQGQGIATYLYKMLIRLAKERGLKGFTAEVLDTNKGMIKVFEKSDLPINARLQHGAYRLTIPFDSKQLKSGDESISTQAS
jgi:GNAT superfamily N-acetyltransferase